MGFCEFQAIKCSQSREIYQCTRKRQGCTGNRRTSGRGSPRDRSFRLCACNHFVVQRIYITNVRTSAEERGDFPRTQFLVVYLFVFNCICLFFICQPTSPKKILQLREVRKSLLLLIVSTHDQLQRR